MIKQRKLLKLVTQKQQLQAKHSRSVMEPSQPYVSHFQKEGTHPIAFSRLSEQALRNQVRARVRVSESQMQNQCRKRSIASQKSKYKKQEQQLNKLKRREKTVLNSFRNITVETKLSIPNGQNRDLGRLTQRSVYDWHHENEDILIQLEEMNQKIISIQTHRAKQ